ncbi:hypothetical protein ABZ654_11285 [Streptomyces hygroscopicus]|uniref:hypothetical protein n=1 Tax=Streptomyces hygroscopicus TaxID=1912 RepID=UPI0033C930DF
MFGREEAPWQAGSRPRSPGRQELPRVFLQAQATDPETASKRERAFAAAFTGTLFGIHIQTLVDRDSVDFDEALQLVATAFGRNFRNNWEDAQCADPARPGEDELAGP